MSDNEVIDEDYEMGDDEDYTFSDDEPAPAPAPVGPLKGRKRFMADLEEIKKTGVIGFTFKGFVLRSTCHRPWANVSIRTELPSDA